MDLVTVDSKESQILRQRMTDFNFDALNRRELRQLVQVMRRVMKKNQGIGLSANQIGLNSNFFVAEVDNKFYAVFNPKIEKVYGEEISLEEGCLSIPQKFGLVPRAEKLTLTGLDINGKKIKIKAWGLLARVFQHEVDHLHGKLFIDKCSDVHTMEPSN